MSRIIRLYDRSRVTTDWACPRKRFYQYEYKRRGITKTTTSLELFTGILIHDSLAAIALGKDIDPIAQAAYDQMYTTLSAAVEGIEGDLEFAKEQSTLIEGLIRGFHRHCWPRILADYPNILHVEEENEYVHPESEDDQRPMLLFMAKPDLIAEGPSGTAYIEYKSTRSKKEDWINAWDTAVQLHSTIKAVKETKGIDIDHVIVQGLYKGYECLAPETPVLTADLLWVPVGDLFIGEKLAGFEEYPTIHKSGRKNKRQWKTAEVTHMGRAVLPSYKVTTEDGTSVVCSENHLWLATRSGGGSGSATWVETKNLTKGHRLLKVVNTWSEIRNYEAGYLAAAFDGEGNISQNKTKEGYWLSHLAFTQKENVMLKAVKQRLLSSGFKFGSNDHRGDEKVGGIYVHTIAQILQFLGQIRPLRLLEKFSFDKLGGMSNMDRPLKIVELKFVGPQQVVTLGTSTETLIASGLATHNSYGKQSSPFCYGYLRSAKPPFVKADIQYEYKYGYRRTPTWEMDGGVTKWIESMPENVLTDQFPRTLPIFINEDLVDAFFDQREIREQEIALGMDLLDKYADDPEMTAYVMNQTFPQKFEECPARGAKQACEFTRLCFGFVADPLTEGFEYREPHHQREREQFAAQEELCVQLEHTDVTVE